MGKLNYSLNFEERGDYLYAFVSGPLDSLEVSKSFFEQINIKAVELGIKHVLVEEDFPNQISYDDMFLLAEYLAELFQQVSKLAHVDRSISDLERNRIGAAVALSSSLLARVFDNTEEAIEWLNG